MISRWRVTANDRAGVVRPRPAARHTHVRNFALSWRGKFVTRVAIVRRGPGLPQHRPLRYSSAAVYLFLILTINYYDINYIIFLLVPNVRPSGRVRPVCDINTRQVHLL